MTVPLSDVKSFLNITTSAQDNELVRTLDQAVATLERRIGPLAPVTVTELHYGLFPLVLRRAPVMSITSLTVSGVTTTTGFDFDPDTGVLYGRYNPGYGTTTSVTYQAGRSPLPADIEAAVLELTKHLWESQRVAQPGTRPGFGGADLNPEVETGARYLLPYRVQTLIEPYLLGPAVA